MNTKIVILCAIAFAATAFFTVAEANSCSDADISLYLEILINLVQSCHCQPGLTLQACIDIILALPGNTCTRDQAAVVAHIYLELVVQLLCGDLVDVDVTVLVNLIPTLLNIACLLSSRTVLTLTIALGPHCPPELLSAAIVIVLNLCGSCCH